MALRRSTWCLIGYSRRLGLASKPAGRCCYRRILALRHLRLTLDLRQCLRLLRVRHLPVHPILHRLLMRHCHHREAAAVALVVEEGVLGAAPAGAAAPWVRVIHVENSATLGASVRNIPVSAVTNWAIWHLDALLQLRPWMFHGLLHRQQSRSRQ